MTAAMTPAEVAADLKLASPESVLRLLRSGSLPGFKAGRFWRVDPDDLAEWKLRSRPADPNRIAPRSARGDANIARRTA